MSVSNVSVTVHLAAPVSALSYSMRCQLGSVVLMEDVVYTYET